MWSARKHPIGAICPLLFSYVLTALLPGQPPERMRPVWRLHCVCGAVRVLPRLPGLSTFAVADLDVDVFTNQWPRFALSIQGLRKAFDDVVAVDNLDLKVRRGECFGLLGPNGAGKTTTIEICEGLTKADGGMVEILGLNWRENAAELRQSIGIQ